MSSTLRKLTEQEGLQIPHAHFGIDPNTGFLLREPLKRLPSGFEFWERLLSDAHGSVTLADDNSSAALARRRDGELWRQRVRAGPVLSTRTLEGHERQLQRAHLVLGFLVHFYAHSLPKDERAPIVIPKTLAIPLVAVSKRLAIAPILTYTDTVIWNLYPIDPARPLGWGNMRFNHVFSGTDDEKAFYITSAGVELRAAELMRIIEEFHAMPNINSKTAVDKVSRMLCRVESIIKDLTEILQSVRTDCDPRVFHDLIRPWYNGSDSGGPTAPGWVYEGVVDSDKLDRSGASAGQSPSMHALDIWLDIDHKLTQQRLPAPTEQNKRSELGFMERMRRYMPGKQREFLQNLLNSPRQLRDLAAAHPDVREQYNKAVLALKNLRDIHIRVVTLYIVTMDGRGNKRQCGPARGTGGTELSVLLKAGRDATFRAVLD